MDENQTIVIKWSRNGWSDKSIHSGYKRPKGISLFPGRDIIEQLTGLMQAHFKAVENTLSKIESDCISRVMLGNLTSDFLDRAEHLITSAIVSDLNAHQLIHLQELSKNCLGALMAFNEAILQHDSGCVKVLTLHPDLCGLLESIDRFSSPTRFQLCRIPYSPPRVGHEVSYEEIANVYRTSRVTIRKLVCYTCYRKLRYRLRKSHDVAGLAGTRIQHHMAAADSW